MTIPVELAGVSGILSVSGISRKRCGMPKPLTLGEVSAEQTERARMLPKSQTHSDTHPACQSHRIAVLSCFILPGLPSQALTRQLSQRASPWQRGFVFDETDWGLLENVTECQSLSLWERWHCEAMTERARMLPKSQTHSDTHPACQSHRIATPLE